MVGDIYPKRNPSLKNDLLVGPIELIGVSKLLVKTHTRREVKG